jgi:hypothetical protein
MCSPVYCSLFILCINIVGCKAQESFKRSSLDLRQMMLGFGFGVQRIEVANSLRSNGYQMDSLKSSIKLNDVTIYNRKATASLSFSLERLRSIKFVLLQEDPSTEEFLDTLYEEVVLKMGEPTTTLGSTKRRSGEGYYA